MKRSLFFILTCFTCVCKSQTGFDVESGVAMFGYNDVRIPGNTATQFSISDDLNSSPTPFIRARVKYTLGKRHTISALYAPLSIKSNGTLQQDLDFQNKTFTAGTPLKVSWKFNSYRLSYTYAFILRERFSLAAGLTGKVRDAKIAVSNSDVTAEKTNVGVVPLVRLYMDWNFCPRFNLILDGDALVGKQGRAEDVFTGLGYTAAKNLTIKAGYRLLEGGADNNEVYNFSSVHYAVIGVMFMIQ